MAPAIGIAATGVDQYKVVAAVRDILVHVGGVGLALELAGKVVLRGNGWGGRRLGHLAGRGRGCDRYAGGHWHPPGKGVRTGAAWRSGQQSRLVSLAESGWLAPHPLPLYTKELSGPND